MLDYDYVQNSTTHPFHRVITLCHKKSDVSREYLTIT